MIRNVETQKVAETFFYIEKVNINITILLRKTF